MCFTFRTIFLHNCDKAWIKTSTILLRTFLWSIISYCPWKNQTISCSFPLEVSFVQVEHCWPAASSALPFVPFGSCSCSLWTSAPGAGMPSSPGVQPCTPARHNAAPHSQCAISSGPRGHPRPRLCGYGRGVMERPFCLKALCWICRPAERKTQGYTQENDAEHSFQGALTEDSLML